MKPTLAPIHQNKTHHEPSAPASASVRQILVVDDHPETAGAMKRILTRAGHQAHVFHRGADALHYAQSHPMDAAVIDVHLPDLNGLILARQFRQLLEDSAPIVIVSGDSSMEVLNSLCLAGATHFFSKPLHARQLLDLLNQHMEPAGR